MLIDTHTHINFPDFKDDYKEVIDRALKENVWLVNVGSDFMTSKRAVQIANEYKEGVYAAVGLHPNDNKNEIFDEEKFLELAKNEKVVAIGETGLDYAIFVREESERIQKRASAEAESEGGLNRIMNYESRIKEKQKELFIKHIELSNKINKPLIIHCRDAHDDLIEFLTFNFKLLTNPPGVMHFFGGNGAWENVGEYLKMGFYISFAGVVTFPKYSHNEDIKKLPLDRIIVETDAPYVTPVPMRGKRNEPSYVKYTAQKIAEIKEISFEELEKQTTKNAKILFRI
ncbi:MAG: Hydrolase, TatD family [Parcubacteria group bacterium GW2011_GWD2_38_12]|nr:MAG: Hydrolase, TatD family [Parcubacteria group bacterium GW2011_GWC2_36_17]KKQ38576.1 MAG: Hydrolase, TatD family [Candidatus Moranbacteria bacterium GW2011_GWF2_37_7]KKQ43754.1 MAG: Hydrolase, TatD family [Parcubacteria group bacterium GW2011_GWE2_37_8]KKQ52155.1 MAG: Hydrolase, TatD family [Parcubacteria group bacterium GW2011_GWD2_38_12]KKQ58881.1 MAG: Hydrolase, TatD family [Parcubacteria group bacterium GW2011_GWC1_38_17]KKQ59552.1 MAG: Hydrolase, TatD family [Parcubacteria group bac